LFAVFAVPPGFFSFWTVVFGLSFFAVEAVFVFLAAAGLDAVLTGLAVFDPLVENDAVHPVKDIPSIETVIIKKSLFFIFSPVFLV